MALDHDNSWDEYRRMVLSELERMNIALAVVAVKIDNLKTSDIADMRVEIAMLKIKAGLWGLIAGAVPSAIAVIAILLR